MKPRVCSVPACVSSRGQEAVELAASAGLILDEWQAFVLKGALGVRADGKWAAFEVGVVVSRQNGKGGILEARELAGLYLWDERMLVHSAHQFDTSLEAFRRLRFLIEGSEELSRRVKRMTQSHGEEGIELVSGQRIRFRTRTKGGGRGFSGDFLGLDEAMILPEASHGALLPTLSARPDPQVFYMGSAVDQEVQEHGVVFSRIRRRGLAGKDPSLAYFEWSLDYPNPDKAPAKVLEDPGAWRAANPAMDIRISEEHVRAELRSMNRRTFAVERLCIGDWPDPDATRQTVIPLDDWNKLMDARSVLRGPVVLAFDVTPDRSRTCIGAAGQRRDGLYHVEIIEDRAGTGWVADRLAGLAQRHDVSHVVCDSASPAAAIVPNVEEAGVQVRMLKAAEYAQACGRLVDAVAERTLRHLGTGELVEAIDGAMTRPLGDAWAWSRKRSSGVNIAPLVAVTMALFVADTEGSSVYEERDLLVV